MASGRVRRRGGVLRRAGGRHHAADRSAAAPGRRRRARVLDAIDDTLGDRLAILITIPYHVRSSEELWRRYRKRRRDHHPRPSGLRQAARGQLRRSTRSTPARSCPAASPPTRSASRAATRRRSTCRATEPSSSATRSPSADGRLVVWAADKVDAKVERFYRERFNPTLEPLLELDFDAVLPTHGQPVMGGGKQALRARPWRRSPGTTADRLPRHEHTHHRERNRRAQGARRADRSARATGARSPRRTSTSSPRSRATTSGSTWTWSAPRPRARSAPRSPTATSRCA